MHGLHRHRRRPLEGLQVYVASSRRNRLYPAVRDRIRDAGAGVFDWNDPPFSWSAIDPCFQDWTVEQYAAALRDSVGAEHVRRYMTAIANCDVCVLLLPAGTDAHCEILAAAHLRKKIIVVFTAGVQRELIHVRFAQGGTFVTSIDELMAELESAATELAAQGA